MAIIDYTLSPKRTCDGKLSTHNSRPNMHEGAATGGQVITSTGSVLLCKRYPVQIRAAPKLHTSAIHPVARLSGSRRASEEQIGDRWCTCAVLDGGGGGLRRHFFDPMHGVLKGLGSAIGITPLNAHGASGWLLTSGGQKTTGYCYTGVNTRYM